MAAPKGRKQRERDGEKVLFANVACDIIDRLDVGAAALGWSRAAYIEEFVRRMPVDEYGVPSWVRDEVDDAQLLLRLQELMRLREERDTSAA